MSDPVTAGLVIGGALQAVGTLQQGLAASSAADFNAKASERDAKAKVALSDREARRTQGAARAAIGASGVSLEGSPLDVLTDNELEAALNRFHILQAGRTQASLDRAEAANERTGAFLSAGATLLGSSSRAFGRKIPGKASGGGSSSVSLV